MRPPKPALFPRSAVVFRLLALTAAFALSSVAAASPDKTELLDAEKAFRVMARWSDARTIELHYVIADGYYMYRDRFSFHVDGKPVRLAKNQFPKGRITQDATFGRVTTYRNSVRLLLPVGLPGGVTRATDVVEVLATSQGCADAGLCYPPLRQYLRLPRGSSVEVGPELDVFSAPFSRPVNQEPLTEQLKKGH